MTTMRLRPVAIAALGLLIVQLGWILAVPPFAGSDEFDHAYRATAVAHGQLVAPPSDATRGTGAMVSVPLDIVRASERQCLGLKYVTARDCSPPSDEPMVDMPSGAGRYNPAYYLLVGPASLPFEGRTALYAMRALSALLCWGVVTGALVVAARTRSRWLVVGCLIAMTPVFFFSTAMLAPNGLEMSAALAVWVTTHALMTRADRRNGSTLALWTLSAVLLALVRGLGPLWLGLILAACLVASGRPWRSALSAWRGKAGNLAALVAGSGALAGVVWTMSQSTLELGHEQVMTHSRADVLAAILEAWPLWIFQSIAAFPSRANPAPPLAYVCELLLLVSLLVVAARHASRRTLVAAGAIAVAAMLIPSAATYRTFDTYSVAWQGRYTLPFSIGTVILLAASLRSVDARWTRAMWGSLGLLFVVGQVLGPVGLALHQQNVSPSVAGGAWPILPPVALTVLFVIGLTLAWASVFPSTRSTERDAVSHDRS